MLVFQTGVNPKRPGVVPIRVGSLRESGGNY